MFKYILKVASLDENLIVKQKARFLNHIFEYKESLDMQKFCPTEVSISESVSSDILLKDRSANNEFDNNNDAKLLQTPDRLPLAPQDELEKAATERHLSVQNHESDLLDHDNSSMSSTTQVEQISSQAISSDTFESYQSSMAHSQA